MAITYVVSFIQHHNSIRVSNSILVAIHSSSQCNPRRNSILVSNFTIPEKEHLLTCFDLFWLSVSVILYISFYSDNFLNISFTVSWLLYISFTVSWLLNIS